jgi:hypothetical protein
MARRIATGADSNHASNTNAEYPLQDAAVACLPKEGLKRYTDQGETTTPTNNISTRLLRLDTR